MIDPAVIEHIEVCWARGDSIKDTRVSVRACFGVAVPFELVHRAFVRMSHAHVGNVLAAREGDNLGLYARNVPEALGPRWPMPSPTVRIGAPASQFNAEMESDPA